MVCKRVVIEEPLTEEALKHPLSAASYTSHTGPFARFNAAKRALRCYGTCSALMRC